MTKKEKFRAAVKQSSTSESSDLVTGVGDVAGFLSAIVNSSFDAIVGKDLNGIVTSWNAAAERMFGYTSAEMIGRSITSIIPPELHLQETLILARIRDGNCVEPFDTVRIAKSGAEIQVSITVSPIKNREGQIIGASKVARDITERKRSEAVLRESEERFRTMANSLPQLAWIARSDGHVYWYNQRWHDYTGLTLAEMHASGRERVHDPAFLPAVLAAWRTALSTGQAFEMEFPLRRADGEFTTFLTRVQPLKDSQEKVLQWFGTSTDVGVLKQMENSLRMTQARLNSTLGTAAVGTWTWDITSNLLVADEFTARIFSIDASQAARGMPVEAYFEAIQDEDKAIVADALAVAIKECGNYNVEFRVRQCQGEYIWLLSRGRVEADATGAATYFHGAIMDISEHKRAQEEIQLLNSDLEVRVAERTAQLEDAIKELEAFSWSVSHDLRAPLRTISGFSQLVLERFGPLLPEEGQGYLHRIGNGAKKMGVLIEDLLMFATTSQQQIVKEQVDTEKQVRSVLADLISQQEGRQIEIHVGSLPACVGDPALLRQVWTNLLSNAIKYTQKREFPQIEVGWESFPEGGAFFVQDNGAGFDMRYADKLFTVFHRLHSARDYEGTGVGLATVYRIVRRHGGQIWADAIVDGGATFYFTLGLQPINS